MLGGYQILDLRKIDLTITKTQSNITNAYVLSQLLKLRDFIDKDYDFSKPIENQLKPVLIRYRDKKAGEKSEGAMFGELAVVDNYYTFQITGRISGALILTIKVAFEEITNAYGAKEWVINTAKIQLQDVLEDLEGNLALEGDLDVSGDLDVGGDAEVTGDASVGGDLSVTGNVSGAKFIGDVALESIKDADGHARFIEDDGIPSSNEGVTSAFCKWSLSGSHLMLVFAGTIAVQTEIANGHAFAQYELPQWIMDKIFPVWSSQYIESRTVIVINDDWTTQELGIVLQKTAYGIQFTNVGSFTATKDRNFRIQFDLLIDNNQE